MSVSPIEGPRDDTSPSSRRRGWGEGGGGVVK